MQIPDWILEYLLAGGSAAVVTLGLFTFLGKNWIRNQLEKNLERAKSEISLQARQRIQLRDKEYEVFPELWSLLVRAHNALSQSIARLRTIPDFERMNEQAKDDWVKQSNLNDEEKKYFNIQENKITAYARILELRDINEAIKSIHKFRSYLTKNRVFLSPEIKEIFDQIESKLRESWSARQLHFDLDGEQADVNFLSKANEIFESDITPLMNEIENIIQKKLFPERNK